MIRKCSINSSPTQTPLLHHHHGRRRMTLGMLLLGPIDGDRKPHPRQSLLRLEIVNEAVIGRNTLKDLMSSSNLIDHTVRDEPDDHQASRVREKIPTSNDMLPPVTSSSGHGGRRVRKGISRPVTASTGFRIRVFKRAWRPVLGVIPEGKLVDTS